MPPSMPRYFVPNMTATSPLVGATVDSHRSPMTMEKTMTDVGVCGKEQEGCNGDGTAEIDPDQKHRLGIALANEAGGKRADDVEEADEGDGEHGIDGRDAEIADIGGKMGGDERRPGSRRRRSLRLAAHSSGARKASRSAAPIDWSNSTGDTVPDFELPASGIASTGMTSINMPSQTKASDQPSAEISPWLIGAKRNMPAEPAARADAEDDRALLRRGVAREGRQNDGEGTPRDREADQHAAADMQHGGCLRRRHHDHADGVQDGGEGQDPPGAEPVGDGAEDRLADAPEQVLDRHGEREGRAVPAALGQQGQLEEAHGRAGAEVQRRDQAAAGDNDPQRIAASGNGPGVVAWVMICVLGAAAS